METATGSGRHVALGPIDRKLGWGKGEKGKSYRSTNEVTPLAAMAATTNNGAIKKANNRTLSNNIANEWASREGYEGWYEGATTR